MGTNDLLNLKSIAQHQKKSFGEVIGLYLREAWYFENWGEKLILIILGAFGIWKIVELIGIYF